MVSIISLHELIVGGLTKDEFQNSIIKNFRCPKNKDVESFLISKAYDSCNRDFSRTYLLIDDEIEELEIYQCLIGYFTILTKQVSIPKSVSGNMKKKLTGSATASSLNTILIAQLGKNYSYDRKNFSGEWILNEAESKCVEAYRLLGTKIIILEHQDTQFLNEFYIRNNYNLLENASDKEKHLHLRYKKIDKVLINEINSYKY